jgi:hypothetical protein
VLNHRKVLCHQSSDIILLAFLGFIALFLSLNAVAKDKKKCNDRKYCIGAIVDEKVYAAWDIDVKPDGHGLPRGQGDAKTGKALFLQNCAKCHGDSDDNFKGRTKYPIIASFPTLVGDDPPLKPASPSDVPAQTVGSYWPYSSTLFDYIRRAMPFWHPQSLADNEVYSIAAYILHQNDIVDENKILNHKNFATIAMPNRQGFVCDPRPDTYNVRCMKDCSVAETDSTAAKVTSHTENSDCMPAFLIK